MTQPESITLPDGRRLAYSTYGGSDGHPVFYFHGAPSTRIEFEFFGLQDAAERGGLWVIAPDRPGLGYSDFQLRRTISAWPADLLELAGHLGIGQFSVLGYSGGAPYAFACAAQIPERLTSVVVVSGTGPHEVPGLTDSINPNSLNFLRMCVERPRLARLMTRGMGFMARRFPDRVARQAISSLPEPDARLMRKPENGRGFARMVSEAARHGGRGPQHDAALMVQPWGIDLSVITMPVQLWHGEEDLNAPVAMAYWLAERIPSAALTVLPAEGHLSIMFTHGAEILEETSAKA